MVDREEQFHSFMPKRSILNIDLPIDKGSFEVFDICNVFKYPDLYADPECH